MTYVYSYAKKCTIKCINLSNTKIVNWTYAFFPKKYLWSHLPVQISPSHTPNSQLVAPVTFDSISQLPILADRHLQVTTGVKTTCPITYDHHHQNGSKSLERVNELIGNLEFFQFSTNQIALGKGKPELPDTFLYLSHFLICFFHLRLLENAQVGRLKGAARDIWRRLSHPNFPEDSRWNTRWMRGSISFASNKIMIKLVGNHSRKCCK